MRFSRRAIVWGGRITVGLVVVAAAAIPVMPTRQSSSGHDIVIADDFEHAMNDITPRTPAEAQAVPPPSPELDAAYKALTARLHEARSGGAFVSVVHADPVRNQLIVGIAGGGSDSQQAVARHVRDIVTESAKGEVPHVKFVRAEAADAGPR